MSHRADRQRRRALHGGHLVALGRLVPVPIDVVDQRRHRCGGAQRRSRRRDVAQLVEPGRLLLDPHRVEDALAAGIADFAQVGRVDTEHHPLDRPIDLPTGPLLAADLRADRLTVEPMGGQVRHRAGIASRDRRTAPPPPSGHHQTVLGPGRRHVEQPHLLRPLLRRAQCLGLVEPGCRPTEQPVLQHAGAPPQLDLDPAAATTRGAVDLDDVDVAEVEALGAVDGHDVDRVGRHIGCGGELAVAALLDRSPEESRHR